MDLFIKIIKFRITIPMKVENESTIVPLVISHPIVRYDPIEMEFSNYLYSSMLRS